MLKLEEIRKSYHHNRGPLQVNLSIHPGQFYLFVGENGSGKSTTIKLISKVIFNGKKDGRMYNDFKQMIFLADKRSYPKLLTPRVYLNYYLATKTPTSKIQEYLERYQIPNRRIGSFSKGMLQKLGIVQTLLSVGDCYLLDEPTDGLDVESIRLFKEDIRGLVEENKSVIISTHNKKIYKELNPHIYTFKEGICNEKK